MQLNILYQDKAKNAGDAAHRQGFSTKYWYKRLVAKCGNYFLNVPYKKICHFNKSKKPIGYRQKKSLSERSERSDVSQRTQ